MKKILVLFLIAAGSALVALSAKAQVSVSININTQPAWGPTGVDYVEYYYLPDLDMYYNVPMHRFYYLSGNRWIYSSSLPARYRNYDLYSIHKVVMTDKNAYLHHSRDVRQYAQFKSRNDQPSIRDSKDDRYVRSKNNWQNNRYKNVPQQPASRPQQPVVRQEIPTTRRQPATRPQQKQPVTRPQRPQQAPNQPASNQHGGNMRTRQSERHGH